MRRCRGYGTLALWRHAVGVVIRRCGVMEASCKRVDVEAFDSRAPDLWRRAGGVLESCRCGGVEIWRHAAGLVKWMNRGIEIWSSGGMLRTGDVLTQEVRCRCVD